MATTHSQTGQAVLGTAIGMMLFLLAGCQTTAAGGGADLSPPALASNYEREGADGTRSFLASQTQRSVQVPQVDFYVGMRQASPVWCKCRDRKALCGCIRKLLCNAAI